MSSSSHIATEPGLSDSDNTKSPTIPSSESTPTRNRDSSITSTLQTRLRSASKTFQESAPPTGFSVAVGNAATGIPTLANIRRGSFGSEGWSGEGQVREKERRASLGRRGSSGGDIPRRRSSALAESPVDCDSTARETIHETVPEGLAVPLRQLKTIPSGEPVVGESSSTANTMERPKVKGVDHRSSSDSNPTSKTAVSSKDEIQYRTTPFDNGYMFPPKHTWGEATVVFLKAAWKFVITPIGFFITIYGLNVVAWGGMLFLLLCNASPAMCKPTCNDINSPRRIWIETDSQILNALFCVTGFGTIPWRFRDLYYLMQYRIQKKEIGLRRLAGINRGWFRLAGSQDLPIEFGTADAVARTENVPESTLAFPLEKTADAPLTGVRAPPTKMWKLEFVVWTMVWNTFLQAVLCGFMWGMNRYDRPSWSTGLFVALACIVAAAGGIMSFIEGNHVKAIEGVPVSEQDQERLRLDREQGVTHNNINDERPKEKKEKEKSSVFHRKHKQDEDVQVELGALKDGAGQFIK